MGSDSKTCVLCCRRRVQMEFVKLVKFDRIRDIMKDMLTEVQRASKELMVRMYGMCATF